MAVNWKEPGVENEATRKNIDTKSDKAVSQTTAAKDKAVENIQNVYDKQKSVSTNSLNPTGDQNKNIAKGEGSKGSINNKSYSDTLRMIRNIDKYNIRPVEDAFSVGTRHTGGAKNLGKMYERPELKTMETRAMDQSIQLDTEQKQLAIALQDAINHKDYDAFVNVYEKMFGVQLTTMQAEQAIRQWMQQQQASSVLAKDAVQWNKEFMRAFDANTLTALMDLSNTDSQLASLLTNTMYGISTPAIEERSIQKTIMELKNRYMREGMSEYAALQKAERDINTLQALNNNVIERNAIRSQKFGAKW